MKATAGKRVRPLSRMPARATRMAAPRVRSGHKPASARAAHSPPPKAKPRDRKTWLALLIPFSVALLLSLLLIGQRVAVEKLANDIARLEAQKIQLQEQNNRLLARAEQLAGYGRIARLARERWGMVSLAPHLVVISPQ